jgi:hypothetical protein
MVPFLREAMRAIAYRLVGLRRGNARHRLKQVATRLPVNRETPKKACRPMLQGGAC